MIYYVADVVRYELVDAASEAEAKELGQALLQGEVHTVRPATPEEIELMNWHNDMVRRQNPAEESP
jgi:sarcosine oxidase delta subunit